MKSTAIKNKKRPAKKHIHHYVKLAVVPHKANDYQPHLIRKFGLLAVLTLVIGIQVIYNLNTSGSVLADKANISREALLNDMNEARSEHQADELKLSPLLNDAAYLKARDMFDKQYWAHEAPDGTQPWKWFAEAGYGYSKAGENLAKNFYTAEATTAAWLKSDGHRANILDPGYTEAGFAVASGTLEGKPTTIVVALYGRPADTGEAFPEAAVAGARSRPLSLVARMGVSVQSMSPVALGSMVILGFVSKIAIIAHMYRHKISLALNRPWYQHHHGAMKAAGMLSLILIMLTMYGGGQV